MKKKQDMFGILRPPVIRAFLGITARKLPDKFIHWKKDDHSKESASPLAIEADIANEYAATFRNVQHLDLQAGYILNEPYSRRQLAIL